MPWWWRLLRRFHVARRWLDDYELDHEIQHWHLHDRLELRARED